MFSFLSNPDAQHHASVGDTCKHGGVVLLLLLAFLFQELVQSSYWCDKLFSFISFLCTGILDHRVILSYSSFVGNLCFE